MREYLFVERNVVPMGAGLRSQWRKLKVVKETPEDFFVLKSDTGSEFARADEELRLSRRHLEETGEFRDVSSGTRFRLWPSRFS